MEHFSCKKFIAWVVDILYANKLDYSLELRYKDQT